MEDQELKKSFNLERAWYITTEIVRYNLSDSQSTKSGNELLKVKIALLRRHYCIRTSDVFSRMLTSARTTNIYTYIFIQQERCQATFSYDERSKKVYPHNVIKVLVDHWIITFFSVCRSNEAKGRTMANNSGQLFSTNKSLLSCSDLHNNR